MNPTPSQLRLAADIIEKNLEWEYFHIEENWVSANSDADVIAVLYRNHEIRIKPQPDKWAAEKAEFVEGKVIQSRLIGYTDSWADCPPPGPCWFDYCEYRIKPWTLSRHIPGFRELTDDEAWHRQDWTEEMLPEGWRPMLLNERPQGGDEAFDGDDWRHDWIALGETLDNPQVEFARHRTRRPLHALKKLVPLGPEDIPAGAEFRWKHEDDEFMREQYEGVSKLGVLLPNRIDRYTWDELMDAWLIKRPGEDWKPCSKPEEIAP